MQKVIDQYRQLILFLAVGAFSAGVNFLTFSIAWQMLGLPYQAASSLGYVLSVIAHFYCNRRYTFKSHTQNPIPQLKKYSFLLVINYFITLSTITFAVETLHLSPYLGTVMAIAMTVGIGFILSRQWIFKIA